MTELKSCQIYVSFINSVVDKLVEEFSFKVKGNVQLFLFVCFTSFSHAEYDVIFNLNERMVLLADPHLTIEGEAKEVYHC